MDFMQVHFFSGNENALITHQQMHHPNKYKILSTIFGKHRVDLPIPID